LFAIGNKVLVDGRGVTFVPSDFIDAGLRGRVIGAMAKVVRAGGSICSCAARWTSAGRPVLTFSGPSSASTRRETD